MHLHYQSKIAAKKALSKNGKVIGNNIMVGVTLCLDRTVTGGTAEPCTQTVGSFCEPTSTSHVSTPIRPLTAAYKAATTENEVGMIMGRFHISWFCASIWMLANLRDRGIAHWIKR